MRHLLCSSRLSAQDNHANMSADDVSHLQRATASATCKWRYEKKCAKSIEAQLRLLFLLCEL